MSYMFSGCSSLEKLDLSSFDTSSVENMSNMFYNCLSLQSLNIKNFQTNCVTTMENMFYGCRSLQELDLYNFNTAKVVHLEKMFANCISLYSLNIDSFKTLNAINMSNMFKNCNSLTSLNLQNFDTSKVSNMNEMFFNCSSLLKLDLQYFNTSLVENMESIFKNCYKLEYLDISNFNTSLITNMGSLFENCFSLKSLNLQSFNTSKAQTMVNIFSNCNSLLSLDLSNFDTSSVTSMDYMFLNCTNIISLNIDNFITSSVISMSYMFHGCSSLLSLNLSNFNSSTISKYKYMFDNIYKDLLYCIDDRKKYVFHSLLSSYKEDCLIICNSFNNKKYIKDKFLCLDNCKDDDKYNLEYKNECYIECPGSSKLIKEKLLCIDSCKNDNIYKYEYKNECYKECPNNTFFINEEYLCYESIPKGYYCNDTRLKTLEKCHKKCIECKEGPTENNNNCLICLDSLFFNMGNCINNCTNGYYIENESNRVCKCMLNKKCLLCSEESSILDLCLYCNKEDGYYPIMSDILRKDGFVDCYKEPEGYFLKNDYYNKCYKGCKFCKELGNEKDNKCLKCFDNYVFINDYDNIYNCYEKCKFNYYYNKENNSQYECTLEDNCPEQYNKYIETKKRCIDQCKNDNIYKYEFKNKCYRKCPEGSFLSFNISYFCEDIAELEKFQSKSLIYEKEVDLPVNNISVESINLITSEYLDQVGNSTNFVSKMVNENYKIYIYKDSSSLEETANEAPQIDFGECYQKVKKYYNINDDLIVTIINNETDKDINGKSSNIYSFSHPETGKILNTNNICDENDKIMVKEDLKSLMKGILDNKKEDYINYLTKQGIDVFNISHRFYSDICYYYESPNKKDIPLKDRIASFFPNVTLCDPGCENRGVELEKMKAKCECTFNDLMNDKIINNLQISAVYNIISIINSLNIQVFKCISKIIKMKYFRRCIGGYFILFLFFIKGICIIILLNNGLYNIRKYLFALSDYFSLFKQKKKLGNEPPRKKKKSKTARIPIKLDEQEISLQNSNNNILSNINLDKLRNKKKRLSTSNLNKNIKQIRNAEKNEKLNINIYNKKNSHEDEIESLNEYLSKINKYINDSFDENDFCDILDKEKRTCFDYFSQKIQKNQLIADTFYNNEILKPKPLKIILLIITIELYFVVNALFYNEEYLSELFNTTKSESFFSFIPRRISQLIYTSTVSIIISYLIGFFCIEEEKIKRIFVRFNKEVLKVKYELTLIIKELEIKFKLFIIFSLILSVFSFIYISCFNFVYPYIRIEWIKSSAFIFIVMQISNILLIITESCIRYLAKKFNSERLFKLSLLLY